jgi:hypothetical protein
MDCEGFERIVLDRVFVELDELTLGAAQRHVAHCSRCRNIEAGLRATREVCRLPILSPGEGFTDNMLASEQQIHALLPLRQRASRAISVLAAYAMRPQLTMAALLLLMIGASLFLIRTRPAERDLIRVSERGVPLVELEPSTLRSGLSSSSVNPELNDETLAVGSAAKQSCGDAAKPLPTDQALRAARCKTDGGLGLDDGCQRACVGSKAFGNSYPSSSGNNADAPSPLRHSGPP